jgi:hypothetical protein
MAHMMLDSFQRADLIEAARRGVDGVDSIVERLKEQSPHAFHTSSTLTSRVFYHKPCLGTPYRRFVTEKVQG